MEILELFFGLLICGIYALLPTISLGCLIYFGYKRYQAHKAEDFENRES